MATFQFKREQRLPASVEEIWEFISSPANLQEITPGKMGFVIRSGSLPETMYPGMIIKYRVKPLLGIPMTWVTEITHVKEGEYFVDEQRVGPYAMWHHEHFIRPIAGGVLMQDIVTYRPPLGFLGRLVNGIVIRRQLHQIFDFRFDVLEKKYGRYRQGNSG